MKLVHSTVSIAVLTLSATLLIQRPTLAKTWACVHLGIGCPQTIQGTSPNPPNPPPSPEPVGFQVCNYASRYPLSVAYVTNQMGRFGSAGSANSIIVSQGWWTVPPNQCQLIYQGNAYDIRAVAAQDGTGRYWPERGGDSYCLHPSQRFTFGTDANNSNLMCVRQGGRKWDGGWIRVGTTSRFYIYPFR